MSEAPKTLEEAMSICWSTARAIMLQKRQMRGHSNIGSLREVLIRVFKDKMARITRAVDDQDLRDRMAEKHVPQEVIDRHVPMPDEGADSLEDDLLDCLNYFVICWLLWKGWWSLPLISELFPEGPIEEDRQRGRAIEGVCPNCHTHFTTDSSSYDEDRPYDGRCPSCVRGYGPRVSASGVRLEGGVP